MSVTHFVCPFAAAATAAASAKLFSVHGLARDPRVAQLLVAKIGPGVAPHTHNKVINFPANFMAISRTQIIFHPLCAAEEAVAYIGF